MHRKICLVVGLLSLLGVPGMLAAQQGPPAQQEAAPQAAPQPPSDAPPQEATEAVPLRVMVGKSLLINTTDRLKRVSVTDPNIADAVVVTPRQVMVHGRTPGEVSLVIWDEAERSRSFDLRVDVDVTAAAEEMKRIFPQENINVSASRSAIVLSGNVSEKETAERAGLIASAFSKNVVNVLAFGPVGAHEVLLEVKFAEVDRTAITQLGVNLLSLPPNKIIGTSSTQQFAPPQLVSTGQDSGTSQTTSALGLSDLLNVFVFRPDIGVAATIKALQQRNLLQILAEPNLIAVNGKEASFLAGGEFPIPVVQGGGLAGGGTSITVQFKEFGVRLSFTPTITPSGNIHLQVKPEVSALDFANGLQIQGFTIPALTTRRAQTELELQDGQGFVIAGLMDNRLTNNMSKIPGLGDIPILGHLFRSKSLQKSKTELMVMVTARRVSPSTQPAPLPQMPQKFLDDKKFDENKPGPAGGK
jgi:pilus assembly protein CpaC